MPKTTRTVHLVSNAHLDPVWLWEWEEGAAEALATFRAAADLGEQFDDYIFCHNEAILYQWVEQYDPALFKRIQRLVRRKRWYILGGWYLQPDCNMPAGEGFVRQLLVGRRYFREKFNVRPTTAVNFDSFGHTRGRNYTEGTLIIDAYDSAEKKMIWRATGTVTVKDSPEKQAKQVEKILTKIGKKWDKILAGKGK